MKSREELQDAADRAFELLEQKSPHQLAVELAVLQRKYNAAMDMLCEARISVEFRHNTTTNFGGTVTTGRLLEKIDVLLAGKLPKPLVPEGWQLVPVSPDYSMLVADGCKEHAEGQKCIHHENRRRIWAAMLAAAPKPEGGA